MQGTFLWEQLSRSQIGHMVLLVFGLVPFNICLENTSADNTLFDWSIKTGVGQDLMFLYEWHCGTRGPAWWTDGNTCISSTAVDSPWQVYDGPRSWLSDYRCLVTFSLFLFVNHRQKQGYSHCHSTNPRSIPQSAVYLLCMQALTVWQKVRVRRLIFYIPWSI